MPRNSLVVYDKGLVLADYLDGSDEYICKYCKDEIAYYLSSFKQDYIVTIDQSTHCIGVSILGLKRGNFIIMDIPSNNLDTTSFVNKFILMLNNMTYKLNVKVVVFEKVMGGVFTKTKAILTSLLTELKSGIRFSQYLNNAKIDEIPNNVWKKHIIDKSKGKNRSRKKIYVVEDLCDMYPDLEEYLKYIPYKDSSGYDGFDALGIGVGYLKHLYDENGNRKATRTSIDSSTIKCYCFIVPINKKFDDSPLKYFDLLVPKKRMPEPEEVIYQDDISIIENALNMTSIANRTYSKITNLLTIIGLCWENDFDFSEDMEYYLFVARRKVTQGTDIVNEMYSPGSFTNMKRHFPCIVIDNISTLDTLDKKMKNEVKRLNELYYKY